MRIAVWTTRITAVFIFLFSFLLTIGYLGGIGVPFRLVPVAAGVHPETVIMTVMLAAGLLLVSPIRSPGRVARSLFALATAFAFARFVEIAAFAGGVPFLDVVFGGLMVDAWAETHPEVAGLNTLATAAFIGLAQLLRARAPRPALAVALVAPVMPAIATFGFSYGFEHFLGEMSPMTTMLLLPLSLAGLVSFIRRPILRPLFADTMLGRLARLQIAAGLAFPWALGALLVVLLDEEGSRAAIQSALMALFAVAVVVAATHAHAATDGRRRRSVRALQRASVTDQLTGLSNRHGAVERLGRLPADQPVGVIIADLDNFKLVNDTWGHATGDQVLVQVAAALNGTLDGDGFVARWGGEEFLIVLPGADHGRSLSLADRLRAALWAIPGPNGLRGEITGSFGVSQRAETEVSLEAAIQRADTALYHAKDTGRDRVVSKIREPVAGDVLAAAPTSRDRSAAA